MKTSPELQKAVAEYRKGSVEAFNTVYEQSYKYLHTCVIHVVKNEDMAMDMLQETYLEISKSISQLKSTEDFLSWAAMIANRKCFAHLKKQKDILLDGSGLGEEGDSTDSVSDYFENIADDEAFIPETVLQDREKQRLIKEIIDDLNDMQRLCVIGFYYNEQKQEEIAEELGIPVNTVKSHLNRAKAKIKEAVVELDVKKGTRLYSIAPFMALLFREEVQACVLRPMSKGLASAVGISAGVGSGVLPGGLEAVKEFITENFGETLGEIFADTIGKAAIKVKALWAKFTAASIQTKAVVATTACAVTIGGVAVVLTPEKEAVEVPVVETVEEVQSVEVEESVQVVEEKTYDIAPELIDALYTVGDYLWAGDIESALEFYGDNYEAESGYYTFFFGYYDPKDSRVKAGREKYHMKGDNRDYSIGYYINLEHFDGANGNDVFIGTYENGKRTGKGYTLVAYPNVIIEANWVDDVPQGMIKYYSHSENNLGRIDITCMEVNVTDGLFDGEANIVRTSYIDGEEHTYKNTVVYDNGKPTVVRNFYEDGTVEERTALQNNYIYGVSGFGSSELMY